MRQLLETFVELANETRRENQPKVTLKIEPLPGEFAGQGRLYVAGHDNRLGQVTRNLIANAISFSPPAESRCNAAANTGASWSTPWRIDGPGIPPANLERIFERFYTDRPENSFGKNSGLGLSISRQIVEAHNGTIRATNHYGGQI